MRTIALSALRRFIATEAKGALLLLAATFVALIWANVDGASYASTMDHDVHTVVNDGLMALFFLVVGLEIKREVLDGELRDRRVAALPVFAAIGGMVVPALVHLALVGDRGWGIPMATDIAFAVGLLALLGPRVPSAAKLFLLALAIVDDIGAIVVIAVVYSDGFEVIPFVIAVLLVVAGAALSRAGALPLPVLVVLGVACWFALHESGVHATLAGVAIGMIAPHASAERLERWLHPWTSYVVIPLFALVNAGVALDVDVLDRHRAVVAGIAAGLVVGKPIGVLLASWLAVRLGAASLPEGVTWPVLGGVGAVAGIGFTISLFIAGLAYDGSTHAAATTGVLLASVLASVVGIALTARATARSHPSSD